jgi:hypothetical protein
MNKNHKSIKIYGIIGKFLCGCAGGIVGFVVEGPVVAISGVFIGAAIGQFFEKSILST